MTDIAEITAAWRFERSGDPEALIRYLKDGGRVTTDHMRQALIRALRGDKPRLNRNWKRDGEIVESMRFFTRRCGLSVEDARAHIADELDLSESRVKQLWESRKG
ncbi:MAG: hypothetical protein HND55_08870 [Pseudomonadota bacterium]|nr:MAG: hypothetical protein HND55_08870 [Pseudomonadota bacterium]